MLLPEGKGKEREMLRGSGEPWEEQARTTAQHSPGEREAAAVWTAGTPPEPDTPLPLSTVGNTFPHRGKPWELTGRKEKKLFQRLLKILLA